MPLLPEASERGNASAWANEDAGHLGISGQVEAGCSGQERENQKACCAQIGSRVAGPWVDQVAFLVIQRDCTLQLGSGAPYWSGKSYRFGDIPKQEHLRVWLPLQFPVFLIAELSHNGQWDHFNSCFRDLSTTDIWGCILLGHGGVGVGGVLCIVRYSAAPWSLPPRCQEHPPAVANQTLGSLCHVCPERENHPLLRTTDLAASEIS